MRRTLQRITNGNASQWLTITPLTADNFDLTPTQFRDALSMRYSKPLLGLRGICDGCGMEMDLNHALNCKKGGLVKQGHDQIRDIIAGLARQVYRGVMVEPIMREGSATEPGLLADIRIHGVWDRERASFYDVRVINADAASYSTRDWISTANEAAKAKHRKYDTAAEDLHGSFIPLITSCEGVLLNSTLILSWLSYDRKYQLRRYNSDLRNGMLVAHWGEAVRVDPNISWMQDPHGKPIMCSNFTCGCRYQVYMLTPLYNGRSGHPGPFENDVTRITQSGLFYVAMGGKRSCLRSTFRGTCMHPGLWSSKRVEVVLVVDQCVPNWMGNDSSNTQERSTKTSGSIQRDSLLRWQDIHNLQNGPQPRFSKSHMYEGELFICLRTQSQADFRDEFEEMRWTVQHFRPTHLTELYGSALCETLNAVHSIGSASNCNDALVERGNALSYSRMAMHRSHGGFSNRLLVPPAG
ncbi:unnamed protein product [Nesidiocoris tenuis]|uniref:Uncharacterized protein n=1 Tax=Nesidiocoris tenuis TaxID=355587 RepID=A0A6H5HCV0_9HEMI|nr:unnamed protein product [Nesidiocoris tenuis]